MYPWQKPCQQTKRREKRADDLDGLKAGAIPQPTQTGRCNPGHAKIKPIEAAYHTVREGINSIA